MADALFVPSANFRFIEPFEMNLKSKIIADLYLWRINMGKR